jgi:hypothetical protein
VAQRCIPPLRPLCSRAYAEVLPLPPALPFAFSHRRSLAAGNKQSHRAARQSGLEGISNREGQFWGGLVCSVCGSWASVAAE